MRFETLHAAAAAGDSSAVNELLARGADPTAPGCDGRTAVECVPRGDPSSDPEDVHRWRIVRGQLERASERIDCIVLDAPTGVIAHPLRVWIARSVPSPADNGGGSLHVDVTPLDAGRLLLRVDGDFRGSGNADPPWTLQADIEVTVDDDGRVAQHHRRKWTST